uniref:AAA+ ATPase domain-containing protein n=1 Tax=viral metagenome TaxID=1070528 RepID=A0A6C0ECH0_9ZZZZ
MTLMSDSNNSPEDPEDDQFNKKNYEKHFDDILNRFMGIIPLLAYTPDLSLYKVIIILLPIIIMIIKPIISKYLFKKKRVNNSYNYKYIYRFNKLNGWTRNEVYDHLESYLDQKLKNMQVNHCYSDESEYNTYKAKFLLPYDKPIVLTWNNHILEITKNLSESLSGASSGGEKNKIPMITIMTKSSLNVIDKFIEDVQNKQQDFEKNKAKIKNQIMQYDTESKSWKPKPIKIKKNFLNTFLKENDVELLKRSIKYFTESESDYDNRGIPYKISYLLYGKPGCGKTSFIYAVARETSRNIYIIPRVPDEEKLRNAITLIPDGSLVVAEEIDTIESLKPRKKSDEKHKANISSPLGFTKIGPINNKVTKNGSDKGDKNDKGDKDDSDDSKAIKISFDDDDFCSYRRDNSYAKEKLKIYLDILDGYDYFRDCIIIMTTNHLDDIDEAVYRPGRVDHKIEFTSADQYQIQNIFKIFYDIEVGQDDLDNMALKNVTTSYIINTAINPNLDDPQNAINIILGLKDI